MPEFTLYSQPEDFLKTAAEPLYRQEALNSLILGIVERVAENPQQYGQDTPFLGTVHDEDGKLLLATAMTPPYGLLLAPTVVGVSEAMSLVLDFMLVQDWPLPDVNGKKPYAEQFANMWAERTGGTAQLDMAQRLYALHKVKPPIGVPGEMIVAQPEHTDLVAEWVRNFEIDCFGHSRSMDLIRPSVEQRIEQGAWHLWMLDGEPVSMCLYGRPIRSTCAVSGVYTPPKYRRNGYAGACVAALSQKLLDDGFTYTTLFTDLANPTSNSVYMKIGYEPLGDFDKYMLKK
ncbi:MAG TPA: GNAT family N-acetyltransferase [Anaerolineales bacterium]|nr:GNAT family N-acetyltransferase [Anaerolineales bacterium]